MLPVLGGVAVRPAVLAALRAAGSLLLRARPETRHAESRLAGLRRFDKLNGRIRDGAIQIVAYLREGSAARRGLSATSAGESESFIQTLLANGGATQVFPRATRGAAGLNAEATTRSSVTQ